MSDGFAIQFKFGPSDSVTTSIPQIAPELSVSLDERLAATHAPNPSALAIYRMAEDNVYTFHKIVSPSKQSLEVEIVGGPIAGIYGNRIIPSQLFVEVGKLFEHHDGSGRIAGVAAYHLVFDGSRPKCWRLRFQWIDTSELTKIHANAEFEERIRASVIANFYSEPNYAAYSLIPTDEQKEVHVVAGHRKGNVDENLADLIELLWTNGVDTWGSCQERRAGTKHAGKAYVSCRRVIQTEAFKRALDEKQIENELKATTMDIAGRDPTHKRLRLSAANVMFSPQDIGRAVEACRLATFEQIPQIAREG